MYRILIERSHRDDYKSLYEYLTVTIDGVIKPVEFKTLDGLQKKINRMLNKEGYSKADLLPVKVIKYRVNSGNYSGSEDYCDCMNNIATDEEVDEVLNGIFGSTESEEDLYDPAEIGDD